jgi:hypothetical protein
MTSSESEGLQAYISDLITATNAGKVNWRTVNPTTFIWETGPPRNARVSLQRVDRVVQVAVSQAVGPPRMAQQFQSSYVFQAFDGRTPTPVLSVDTSGDPELTKRITELFELVKSSVSRKTLDFLRSILPGE